MAKPSNDFALIDDEGLVEMAVDGQPSPRKALLIEELAKRALSDPQLSDAACRAISSERAMRPRLGLPLGTLGGAAILDSGDETLIAILLTAMDAWSADEQRDLIRQVAGREAFETYTRDLQNKYNWTPQYAVATA